MQTVHYLWIPASSSSSSASAVVLAALSPHY